MLWCLVELLLVIWSVAMSFQSGDLRNVARCVAVKLFMNLIPATGRIYILILGETGFRSLINFIFVFVPERTATRGCTELTGTFVDGKCGNTVSIWGQGSFAQVLQQTPINLHGHSHSSSKQNRGSGRKLKKYLK